MLCDICGKKKATVHLTEIVDEQMSEMHLCEDCARQKSLQVEQQFGLADLLAGLADFGKPSQDVSKTAKLKCENCGLNYDDFRKFGRLGCSECYTAFKAHLTTLLKKIHGSNQHFGKAPMQLLDSHKTTMQTLQDLRNELQKAIDMEDFERAAELRDKIRDFERKGEKRK